MVCPTKRAVACIPLAPPVRYDGAELSNKWLLGDWNTAGNHDIEAVFIDSVLKQANITLESLAAFLHKLNKISTENNIDFYLSISADKKDIPGIDSSDCTVVS